MKINKRGDDMFRFVQEVNFDSYENSLNSRRKKYEALCNVEPNVFSLVRGGELVDVDFDGLNEVIWNAIIIRKDIKRNKIIILIP